MESTKVSSEYDLLFCFNNVYTQVEELAFKSVVNIDIPVYSQFIHLTSNDCLAIIKNELHNLNQPLPEKMLLIYLLSDYISCGFSSPDFYVTFNSTLKLSKSKNALLKSLSTIWYFLFRALKITDSNYESIKHFVKVLERLFNRILISVDDYSINLKFKQVIDFMQDLIMDNDSKVKKSRVLHDLDSNNINPPVNSKIKPIVHVDKKSNINKSKFSNLIFPIP